MANLVLGPSVIKYAKKAFDTKQDVQGGFDEFLKKLSSPESSSSLPLQADTSHPLSHYYISSSHNTYLTGNQLWSKSSTEAYKDVLKRGCRCIEIDVWDGGSPDSSDAESVNDTEQSEVKGLRGLVKKQLGRFRADSHPDKIVRVDSEPPDNDDTVMPTPWRTISEHGEPQVLHGHTATKEVSFRKVCEIIRDYAFRTTALPLIVSLEVHCSPAQQDIMVEIMHDYWGQFLVKLPEACSDATPLPTLDSLIKKILIKVKYSPPESPGSKDISLHSSKSKDEHEIPADENPAEAVKKGKITEALSRMGIFTRACHFHSLEQPEAKMPTHVFAVSETKLLTMREEQPELLFKHNLAYIMRVYPKATRLRSSNLDPAPFWRTGVQLVALNWQTLNAAMMLNEAQFEGSGGWVLKPSALLPGGNHPPKLERVKLDLTATILAGQNLGLEKDVPNAYVKCELHVESEEELEEDRIPNEGKSTGGQRKRRSTTHHARDPDFAGQMMEFCGVQQVVTELSWLRIKVMDETLYQKDRLLGWVCYRLDRMPQGLQLVRLRGPDAKFSGGLLLVDLKIHVGLGS